MTAPRLPGKGLKFIHFASSLWTLFLRHCAAVWGKVEEVQPPHLVLPITIEPSKPRLCIDAHTPFSLDKLIDVPRFVYKNSFMSKIDEKSGYDHILLTKESSKYFGIEWKGLWCWVCTTLPFGWKNSLYVYQTIGLVATNFFRQKGIACSLYIDDRLDGELFTRKGFWPRPIGQRDTGYSYKSATLQAFLIPEKKKEKFASPREGILIHKSSIPLKSLQRLMGKCITFSLAFPGAKFYIREMAQAVGRASPKGEIQLTAKLREEMEFWRLFDEWDRHIPWKNEKHWVLSASTDASLSRWAGVIHCQPDDVVLGDFWGSDLAEVNTNVKEMWAIAKVLESLSSDIRDCRVDVQVDNQAVIHTWMGRGGRSRELTKVAQHIFQLVTQRIYFGTVLCAIQEQSC